MRRLGVPTKLKDFLRYCGCDTKHYTKPDRRKKEEVLKALSKKIKVKSASLADITGTTMILRARNFSHLDNFELEEDSDPRGHCNKDTEGIVTMNTYSRGHQFFVSGKYQFHFTSTPLQLATFRPQITTSTTTTTRLGVQSA